MTVDPTRPLVGAFPSRFTIEADEAGERRVLAGLAVPFGEVGYTSWGPTKFTPGSLSSAAGIPAVRAHDDDRLIGLVATSDVGDGGVTAKVRVSKVSAGDEVLVLADDGALTGFSGSWRPTKYGFEQDADHGEVVVIEAADWVHLSVVTTPAFNSARITTVAASRPVQEGTTDVADPTTVDAASTATPTTTAVTVDVPGLAELVASLTATTDALKAQADAQVARLAEAPKLEASTGPQAKPFRNIGDFTFSLVKAMKGSENDKGRIEAALREAHKGDLQAALDETTTALNTGLVPPVYTATVLGGLPVSTPILDMLVRHEALPATGMSMIKPEWSTLPNGDWISSENTEPASDAVAVGTSTVSVLTWGHAVKASVNLIERGTFGGFAQNYFNQCRISFASDHEAKAKEVMFTAADTIAKTSGSQSALASIAQVVEYLIENQRDANNNFRGLAPDFVGLAADEFGDLVQEDAFLPFAAGNASWGTMMGQVAGLTVVLLPSLSQGDFLAGARAATVVYDDQPMELRATVVNTMSIELGVIANTAVDVEYPDALVKITAGS